MRVFPFSEKTFLDSYITPKSLPHLCQCLEDAADLTRDRAQQAMKSKQLASDLGRETIEAMANLYRTSADERSTHSMSATYLDWSLKEIEHDQAEWLQAWAEAEQTAILRHVRRLNANVWPVWLELLVNSSLPIQEALLDSTLWLLRRKRIKEEQISQLVPIFMGLTEAADSSVRLAAFCAIGYLPDSEAETVQSLLTRLPEEEALLEPLARLAGDSQDNRLRDEVRTALLKALPDEKAAAALVRLAVSEALGKEREEWKYSLESVSAETKAQTNATLLQQLRQWLSESETLLHALLAAGTDDDWWGSYHERLVMLACEVVQ